MKLTVMMVVLAFAAGHVTGEVRITKKLWRTYASITPLMVNCGAKSDVSR